MPGSRPPSATGPSSAKGVADQPLSSPFAPDRQFIPFTVPAPSDIPVTPRTPPTSQRGTSPTSKRAAGSPQAKTRRTPPASQPPPVTPEAKTRRPPPGSSQPPPALPPPPAPEEDIKVITTPRLVTKTELPECRPPATTSKKAESPSKKTTKKVLAESLTRLSSGVQYLALTKALLGDKGIKDLVGALMRNKTVKWLHLDENKIGDSGAVFLAKVLSASTVLQVLDLDFNAISNRGACALASALSANKSLRELDLHFNLIGNAGASNFAEALEVNSTLRSFSLHGNDIGDLGAATLARSLQKNEALRDLHLGRTSITDKGAAQCAKALRTNGGLYALHLTENQISDAGAVSLAKALFTNTALMEIWLQNNNITEVGARELSKCLHRPYKLRRLGLTLLDQSGSRALEPLSPLSPLSPSKVRRSLQHAEKSLSAGVSCLYLDQILGDDGVKELVEMIANNKSLREVHLKKSRISEAGVQDLAKALQKCACLEKIYLGGNDVGASGPSVLLQKPRSPKPPSTKRRGKSKNKDRRSSSENGARSEPRKAPSRKGDESVPPSGKGSKPLRSDVLGQSSPPPSESGGAILDFNDVPDDFADQISDISSSIADNLDTVIGAQDQDIAKQDKVSAGSSPGDIKRGFFGKIGQRFVGTKPCRDGQSGERSQPKTYKVLRKLGLRRIEAGDELITLTFDQVPDLPAISDTESSCSVNSISSISSGPREILNFDQVPEELPVSDDEEEKKPAPKAEKGAEAKKPAPQAEKGSEAKEDKSPLETIESVDI